METTENDRKRTEPALWEALTHRNSEQDGNEHHTDHVRSDRDEPRVRGKIPVAGIRQQHHDSFPFIFRPPGGFYGSPQSRAGRNADEDPFPACQSGARLRKPELL